jgi:hypothetical protein
VSAQLEYPGQLEDAEDLQDLVESPALCLLRLLVKVRIPYTIVNLN